MVGCAAVVLVALGAGLVTAGGPPGNRVTGAVYEKVYGPDGKVTSQPSEDAVVSIVNRSVRDSTSRDGLYYILAPGDLEKFQLIVKKESYQAKYSEVYRNERDPIKAARILLEPTDPQAANIQQVLDIELKTLREAASDRVKDLVFADLMRLTNTLTQGHAAYVKSETARVPTVEGPEVVWQVSLTGVRRPSTESLEFLSRRVARRTNGRFHMVLRYREELAPFSENLERLGKGKFEAAVFCADERRTPALSALNLPFLPLRDLDVTQRVQEDYFRHPVVVKEMERWNVYLAMPNPLSQSEFMGIGAPPLDVDGWKGRRVSAFGRLGDAMSKIGSVSTPVAGSELYMALKETKVEAAAVPFSYVHVLWQLQDVSRWYTSNMRARSEACPVAVNADAWRKLPEAYKKLINEVRAETYQELAAAYRRSDEKNIAIFAQLGLLDVRYPERELDKFVAEGGVPTWQQWVKEAENRGLRGKDLLNFILVAARKTSGG